MSIRAATRARRGLSVLAMICASNGCGGDDPDRGTEDAALLDRTERSEVTTQPAALAGASESTSASGIEEALGGVDALGGLLGLVEGTSPVAKPWPLPDRPTSWAPVEAPPVPVVRGLTVTTAIEDPRGDYESVKRIVEVDTEAVKLDYASLGHGASGNADPDPGPAAAGAGSDIQVSRRVLQLDRRDSHRYRMSYGANDPPEFAGWTAIGVSASVLRGLREAGRAPLEVISPGDLLGSVIAAGAGIESLPIAGELERMETDVPFPVLWNGERRWLRAVHVRGAFRGAVSSVPVEFVFLDDPDNPLTLRASVGAVRLQLVRIDLLAVETETGIEQALETVGAIDLPGIYFASASADILPASDAVLDQVADVLTKHTDWTVEVAGHTDAIGLDAANLRLSRARAAAVVDALVGRVGMQLQARIRQTGYGEAQPVEPNDTMEGRARNRRVSLRRIDP